MCWRKADAVRVASVLHQSFFSFFFHQLSVILIESASITLTHIVLLKVFARASHVHML